MQQKQMLESKWIVCQTVSECSVVWRRSRMVYRTGVITEGDSN